MGCCELHIFGNEVLPTKTVARRLMNQGRTHNPISKRVTFTLNSPDELRYSLSKRVVVLENCPFSPLHNLVKEAEELLFRPTWISLKEGDALSIRCHPHPTAGSVFNIELHFDDVLQLEYVLSLMNSVSLRPKWDTEVTKMTLLTGHRLLDAKIRLEKDGIEDSVGVTRCVRKYRSGLLMAEFEGDFTKNQGFVYVFVCSEDSHSVVEVLCTGKDDSFKVIKTWAKRLQHELFKDPNAVLS